MRRKVVSLFLAGLLVVVLGLPAGVFGSTGPSLKTVDGIVTDVDTGAPIGGVAVTLSGTYGSYGVSDENIIGATTTSADGRYAFSLSRNIIATDRFKVTAVGGISSGYGTAEATFEWGADTSLSRTQNLQLSKDAVVLIDESNNTGIGIVADPGVIPPNTRLVVTPIFGGAEFDKAKAALGGAGASWVYDITLIQTTGGASAVVQPNGTILIGIPVPAGYDGNRLWVYRIEANGSGTDMGATFDRESGYMFFTTNHLSTYAVGYWAGGGGGGGTSSPVKQTGADTGLAGLIGIGLMAGLGAAFIIARRKGLFER